MITRDFNKDTRLSIFNDFIIDYSLPKHSTKNNSSIITINNTSTDIVSNNPIILVQNVEHDSNEKISENVSEKLKEILKYIKKSFFRRNEKIATETLFNFFQKIPFNNLNNLKEVIEYYEKSIIHAHETGQTALKENLTSMLEVVKNELILIDAQINKYISEEQLITLYETVCDSKYNYNEKRLKLSWIKNFIKVIPTSVASVKKEADKLNVFDNYVILHYDPHNNATNLTEKEIILKKDPILFGVFKNSNKLYYIADWVDEYCDLTLEKLITELKDDVLMINNQSVKTFINNGALKK